MGREPRPRPVAAEPEAVFKKIGRQIEPAADPAIGAYLVRLVKDKRELARLKKNPARTLKAHGIDPEKVKTDVLVRVAESVFSRIERFRNPGDILSTVTSKESSTHQEVNFDNSSSWYWNKDGYNVMYEAGHSKEQSTGEMVGQDTKFDGLGLHDFDAVLQHALGEVFFPSQPLVSPDLVNQIKAIAKDVQR